MSNKVCLVISTLSGGGAEGVCINLANGLAERGLDVTLLVLNLNKADYLDRVNEKVTIYSLDVDKARYCGFKLREFINGNEISKYVVFNYELAVLLIMIRYSFIKDIKIISRNINTISKNKNDIKGLFGRYIAIPLINNLYSKSDHIVNQCVGMKDDLIRELPKVKGKVSVIYNPVNKIIENYNHKNKEENKSEDDYILCVGRLDKQKAFHIAIEAFASVVKKHHKLKLKIVGQGPLLSELESLVERLDIKESVDFEGFQSDIIPYYLGASMTLMTSDYEGFPNVLIESITLGTPIVSLDCNSGPREIITKSNGILVNIEDFDGLVMAINKTYENKSDFYNVIESSKYFRNEKIIENWMLLLNDF
ncbi:glycosyltransferase [Photobacterium toruni]|uniref:glycosyltransferase n=1 Tax=Photobacterium toruni TaxID=1935446 RepID=UPI002E19C28D|nr:glycosyltransferase [Photobacterium toruni]